MAATLTPVLSFPPEVLLKAQGIRACIFDVDGVLTDGRIYIGANGEEFKAFNTLDGHGLKLLAQGAVHGVADAEVGHDKLAAANGLLASLQLDWSQMGAIGDDWPDLPLMTRTGFTCAPANAHAEVLAIAHHVTQARGGYGAARECCDLLLTAVGAYARLLHGHLTTLDGTP